MREPRFPAADREALRRHPDFLKAAHYMPGVPKFSIDFQGVADSIHSSFAAFDVKTIERMGQSMGNQAFLVNGEYLFRFPKDEGTSDLEIRVLPEIGQVVSLPIPQIEYVGRDVNGQQFIGYPAIPGKQLKRKQVFDESGVAKPQIVSAVGDFFQEIHSFSVDRARELGIREPNLMAQTMGQLERAREVLYPVIQETYPNDAAVLVERIEAIFDGYLTDPRNFEFTPVLCHGDLEAEHILYLQDEERVTGIIDFDGVKITDPDYDLWRPYDHYGKPFIEALLQRHPHPDPDSLYEKLESYRAIQQAHRLVRAILRKDEWLGESLERMRSKLLSF